LANALQISGLFKKVYLFSSVLYKSHQTPSFTSFQKRVKPIHREVIIKNHFLYELLSKITRNIYNKVIINPNKQVHNNPIYFWQFIFGLVCLPAIWRHRNNTILVTYETAAWPVVWLAKKWRIPVIMDFPSISHEAAKPLGINETDFGIAIKKRERIHIDYALFCSDFCRKSFEGLTSSKKDYVLYLGADRAENKMLEVESRESEDNRLENIVTSEILKQVQGDRKKIKISFIANLEYRKGLDILLEALYAYSYPVFLEVHLIGKIRKEWVEKHMPESVINNQASLIFKEAMSQQELFAYLAQEQFDLNVQPSRFDSFAMVVPETMMQGIPNLVSPFVGAGEMLNHGEDGFVMESLSAPSLSASLNQFMNLSTEERRKLKDEVYKSTSKMTWEKYNLAAAKVFKEILKDLD